MPGHGNAYLGTHCQHCQVQVRIASIARVPLAMLAMRTWAFLAMRQCVPQVRIASIAIKIAKTRFLNFGPYVLQ